MFLLSLYLRKFARGLYAIPKTLVGYLVWPLEGMLERRSWDRLVEMAGRKGLTVKAPVDDEVTGVVYGEVNGTPVILKPNDTEQSTVSALFRNEKQFVLGMEGSTPENDLISELAARSDHLKHVFKWCRCSSDELERLKQHPEVLDHLVEFYSKWMWHMSKVTVNEHKMECRLRQFSFVPAIPVSIAEGLVPDMVKIVSELEAILGQAGQEVKLDWYLEDDAA